MKMGLEYQIFDLRSQISNIRLSAAKIALLVLMAVHSAPALAAEPPRSTDDQLRDSLNSKAGDEYDRELLGDAVKPDAKGRVDEELQKKLAKELGAAAQKEDKAKDPLLQVAEEMRDAQKRLDRRDSGKVTQYLQRQIVSDLGKLIEQARKSGNCSGSKSGGPKSMANGSTKPKNNPGQPSESSPQPAKDSDPRLRKPEEILAEKREMTRREMISLFDPKLEQRERQHVLELPSECFLPEYELEIEDYFRRLSDDQRDAEKPR